MGVVQLNIILLQRVTGRPGPRWTRSTRCDPKVPQNRPFRKFNHILHLACEFLPTDNQVQLEGANACVSQRANGAEERLETSLIVTQQGMLYF
ncbi:hypothetical protein EV363DRAFT_1172247 [Boletus edulis]|nr:hypothetical protein EV363DRAFT_1172247 [Boletus edulis]